MPRRSNNNRRSYRIRNYTPILKEVDTTVVLPGNATTSNLQALIKNDSTETSNLTVRGFNMSLYAEMISSSANSSLIEKVEFFIMFIPEGYNVSVNLPFTHPEWILNYQFQGTPNGDSQPPGYNIRVNSKRVRKLRPGDQIALFTLATSEQAAETGIIIKGLIKYLSKRN